MWVEKLMVQIVIANKMNIIWTNITYICYTYKHKYYFYLIIQQTTSDFYLSASVLGSEEIVVTW